MLAAVPFQVYGQDRRGPTRIRFKRGQSSTTVSGQLSSRRLQQVFLIGGQAGQELYVQIKARSSDGVDFVSVLFYDPAGKPLGTTQDDIRIRLKQTGNYRIELSPPGSFYRENLKGYKQLQFTLFVRIQ
jgi:hypothetical protein